MGSEREPARITQGFSFAVESTYPTEGVVSTGVVGDTVIFCIRIDPNNLTFKDKEE
jgi:hypothetical protein